MMKKWNSLTLDPLTLPDGEKPHTVWIKVDKDQISWPMKGKPIIAILKCPGDKYLDWQPASLEYLEGDISENFYMYKYWEEMNLADYRPLLVESGLKAPRDYA